MAVDQLLQYLISDQAKPIRVNLARQLVESLDLLESDVSDFIRSFAGNIDILNILLDATRNGFNRSSASIFFESFLQEIQRSDKASSSLKTFGRISRSLITSNNLNSENFSKLLVKILNEPVLQDLLGQVISELSERLSVKLVRRVFGRINYYFITNTPQ